MVSHDVGYLHLFDATAPPAENLERLKFNIMHASASSNLTMIVRDTFGRVRYGPCGSTFLPRYIDIRKSTLRFKGIIFFLEYFSVYSSLEAAQKGRNACNSLQGATDQLVLEPIVELIYDSGISR